MQSAADWMGRYLNVGIAGSSVTPLRLLIVVALLTVLVWTTRRGTRWFVERVLAGRGVDEGLREALGAIVRYGLLALGSLIILQGAGIDLTSLNVLVGAIGVGLGFGLQAVTSNFFSGLILLIERPINVGQRVEIAGAVGIVKEIAARATTLVTDENVAIVVPNSQFISERVTNWSRPNALTAYALTFHVAHSADPDAVRQVLLAAASSHGQVEATPSPEVEFLEMGLASLRFQLQVWSTAHTNTAGALRSELNFDIWRRLKAQGIDLAVAHTVATAPSPPSR